MEALSDVHNWKKGFGLLPIRLNPKLQDSRYLMLDGEIGAFCLQTEQSDDDIGQFFKYSWSTNTKNFVVLGSDIVKVYNWTTRNVESIPREKIESNFVAFNKYLHSKSFKSPNDIVPFVLDIFRQLRNVTRERKSPSEALGLLFQLLISLEETDNSSISYDKWGLPDIPLPSQFEYFVGQIKQGVKNITPNLDLILRHVSGSLFQEAHKEVIYFNPDRDLFGGISSKLKTQDKLYSSIHYTPQYLARAIVEQSLKLIDLQKPTIRIFDPACGSSEFLIEALKQLENCGYEGHVIIKGYDTSEIAVETSNFLLGYEKRTQWAEKLNFSVEVVEDSLSMAWSNDYDLILMNPPFVSWNLLSLKSSRDAIIETLGPAYKKGKPNQASAFLYKAAKYLASNGVIGCVLPTSILTSDAYDNLREEIANMLTLQLIAKLGNFVFEDALTDVSFLIGMKPPEAKIPKVMWCANEKGGVPEALRELRKMETNNDHAVDEKQFSVYVPSKFPFLPRSWKIPSIKEHQFLKDVDRFRSEGKLSRIADIFTIRQGAILGIKGIFKISKDTYEGLNQDERKFFRPVVTNAAISKGAITIFEYLWYPYNEEGMMIQNEDQLTNLSFGVSNLIPNKDSLIRRSGIIEWWGLTRPRSWQYTFEPRLFSCRFGNSNSFAFDESGTYVIEEGNAFIPKSNFESADSYFYLACFSSQIFDQLLSIFSKQILAGFDLGNNQIKNIPIPNINRPALRDSEPYQKLVELGRGLQNGNFYVRDTINEVLRSHFYPRDQES